jgi:hypothetical protein
MIQRMDGRVVLGGGRYLSPNMDTGISDAQAPMLPHVLQMLREFLPKHFEQVFGEGGKNGEVSVSHAWNGILAFTNDFNPFVGGLPTPSSTPGQFVAAGFSGHGMPRCHLMAEKIAQQVEAFLNEGTFEPIQLDSEPRGLPLTPSEELLLMIGLTKEELTRMQQATTNDASADNPATAVATAAAASSRARL